MICIIFRSRAHRSKPRDKAQLAFRGWRRFQHGLPHRRRRRRADHWLPEGLPLSGGVLRNWTTWMMRRQLHRQLGQPPHRRSRHQPLRPLRQASAFQRRLLRPKMYHHLQRPHSGERHQTRIGRPRPRRDPCRRPHHRPRHESCHSRRHEPRHSRRHEPRHSRHHKPRHIRCQP